MVHDLRHSFKMAVARCRTRERATLRNGTTSKFVSRDEILPEHGNDTPMKAYKASVRESPYAIQLVTECGSTMAPEGVLVFSGISHARKLTSFSKLVAILSQYPLRVKYPSTLNELSCLSCNCGVDVAGLLMNIFKLWDTRFLCFNFVGIL